MLYNRSIVVEQQALPVSSEARNGIAVSVDQVVRVSIEGSLSAIDILLVLQDGIVGSTGYVTLSPSTLPTLGEVVADAGLAQLTLLGGHQDNAVGSTCTIDGT